MAIIMQEPEEEKWVYDYKESDLGMGWKMKTLYIGPETWQHRGERWFPCGWVGKSDYCIPCAREKGLEVTDESIFLC